ncbi:hypothetical protein SLEP1_g22229 [Rubroshorea leprosula]|uniref:Uncharacterized protein n=1 Tax=Rubroshorea leprosula TaxID=152421 RepID=A0AAV5JFT6_9ROSI|nr:hypothetical protein SLEP1_g22229 [Rubroshorea leprosula]
MEGKYQSAHKSQENQASRMPMLASWAAPPVLPPLGLKL